MLQHIKDFAYSDIGLCCYKDDDIFNVFGENNWLIKVRLIEGFVPIALNYTNTARQQSIALPGNILDDITVDTLEAAEIDSLADVIFLSGVYLNIPVAFILDLKQQLMLIAHGEQNKPDIETIESELRRIESEIRDNYTLHGNDGEAEIDTKRIKQLALHVEHLRQRRGYKR